jgi:hypothetical protein
MMEDTAPNLTSRQGVATADRHLWGTFDLLWVADSV